MPTQSLAQYTDESVCSTVGIEIRQELTLERQAFDAEMKINNPLTDLSVENVNITVNFADEEGQEVIGSSNPNHPSALFFIRLDSKVNISSTSNEAITDGIIPPNSEAVIKWLIIPAPDSSNGVPTGTLYYVGATVDYTLSGTDNHVEVSPDYIYVKPMPELVLDYFLPKDVYADDPFTQEIEPPVPFSLGVRVRNQGFGPAKKLKIESAQPTITDNFNGLNVGFHIDGSEVNGEEFTPSLLVDFGDIEPDTAGTARWIMTSTLTGQFENFTARYTHADELGGQLTSLIEELNTHTLVQDVWVDLPGRDDIRDFLTVDGFDYTVYESDNTESPVNDQSGSSSFQYVTTANGEEVYDLNVPVTAGFMFVQLVDPFSGTKDLKEVTRTDGKVVQLNNAWLSHTYESNPLDRQYHFNIFDVNTTNSYRVVFQDPSASPQAPVLQFIPDRTSVETEQVSFVVQATDPNGTIPQLFTSNLPYGASFVDAGNGTGVFDWTTEAGQAGQYPVTFTATDGENSVTRSIVLNINSATDTDGDGMNDDWEIQNFGDLSRDGTGDFDGDGISDLDEFLNGSDPTQQTENWQSIDDINAPDGRSDHTAIWVGDKMIVWGGIGSTSLLNDGGVYDPETDTWTHISTVNAPSARHSHTAVWTGTEMIIWGGYDGTVALNDGGIYDPATDTWRDISTDFRAPSPRMNHVAVWIENHMIIWGGEDENHNYLSDGGRYIHSFDRWSSIGTTNAPSGRIDPAVLVFDNLLFIWGGLNDTPYLNDGAIYNWHTSEWTTVSANGLTPRRRAHAFWTGSRILVWGGDSAAETPGELQDGSLYDPFTDTWEAIEPSPLRGNVRGDAIWTGNRMVVWGGYYSDAAAGIVFSDGQSYNPVTDTWNAVATTNQPSERWDHTLVWTGSKIIAWGGQDFSTSTKLHTGGAYLPQATSAVPQIEVHTPYNNYWAIDNQVNIKWTDEDPDSDAVIDVFYLDLAGVKQPIATGISEDADGISDELVWDVSSLPRGDYTLIVEISDTDAFIQKTITGINVNKITTSGALTENEVWFGDILITGDITVPEGITLNITPGTTVRMEALSDDVGTGDPDRIEIFVEGFLNADGSSQEKIVFTSASATPQKEDWVGLIFNGGFIGGIHQTIDYCMIQYARDGIAGSIDNSFSVFLISDTSIEYMSRHGIHFEALNNASPSIDIFNNTINDVSGCGIYLKSADAGTNIITNISNNQISNVFENTEPGTRPGDISSGISIYTEERGKIILNITDNDIHDIVKHGVFVESYSDTPQAIDSSIFKISNNDVYRITENTAILVTNPQGSHEFEINDNVIHDSAHGIRFNDYGHLTGDYNSKAFIINNRIDNNVGNGIVCSGSSLDAVINENYLSVDEAGFYFSDLGKVTVAYNQVFTLGSFPLHLSTGGDYNIVYNDIFTFYTVFVSIAGVDSLSLNYNNILGSNPTYVIHNVSNVNIDARQNYWGPDLTTEMETGSNPKNISKIFDFYDDPAKGVVDYAGWSSSSIILPNNLVSNILVPVDGFATNDSLIEVFGVAFVPNGYPEAPESPVNGIREIQVSTDNGATWQPVTGTHVWSYTWSLPSDGSYSLISRVTDIQDNVEVPGPGINVIRDTLLPSSQMTVVDSPVYSTDVQLEWGGTDNAGGSGISTYSVYVSDNSGAFTEYLTNTTETTTVFTGEDNHTYAFYSIATDLAGNIEAAPLTPDTTFTIMASPDTDGDGMDDAWEIIHFGDLSRDGTGDYDGDGITDLNEFLNGTDPKFIDENWQEISPSSGFFLDTTPSSVIWSGSEMILWGGDSNYVSAKYSPQADSWQQVSVTGKPDNRDNHITVWTGTEMIVWGGIVNGVETNTGGIYNPTTDTWRSMNISGVPSARYGAYAAWTGTHMIVWGGAKSVATGVIQKYNSGAIYDPESDTWAPMTQINAPSGRLSAVAVWTGKYFIIWGGGNYTEFGSGAKFDPDLDEWSPISPSPLYTRHDAHSFWTGTHMFVWGGRNSLTDADSTKGALYNPLTDSWSETAPSPIPVDSTHDNNGDRAVWTGDRVLIWGGFYDDSSSGARIFYDGLIYNPITDTWSGIANVNQPSDRGYHGAVWTGEKMIVWGGINIISGQSYNDGAIYTPPYLGEAPTITIDTPAADVNIATGSVQIEWTDDDSDSDASISLYYADNNWVETLIAENIDEDPDGSSDTYLWDISGIVEGTYQIIARITDGTFADQSISIGSVKIDRTAPVITITPPGQLSATDLSVTITTDEPAFIYYTLDGSDPDTNSSLYSTPLTIDSIVTLKVRAYDAVNNSSGITAEDYVVIDPADTALNLTDNPEWSQDSTPSWNWSIVNSSVTPYIQGYLYSLDGTAELFTTATSFTSPVLADGSYDFKVRAKLSDTYLGLQETDDFGVDTIRPVITNFVLNGGELATSDTTVNAVITCNDGVGSGVLSEKVSVENGPYLDLINNTVQLTSNYGRQFAYARVFDRAGNGSTVSPASITLTLSTGTISGTTSDADEVQLIDLQSGLVHAPMTISNGSYNFSGMPSGVYGLIFSNGVFSSGYSVRVPIYEGNSLDMGAYSVGNVAGSISGTINPVFEDAEILLGKNLGQGYFLELQRTDTLTDGSFTFNDVVPGDYVLQAIPSSGIAHASAMRNVSIAGAENVVSNLELYPATFIENSIGKHLRYVRMVNNDFYSVTPNFWDGNSMYSFRLKDGDYTLLAKDDYDFMAPLLISIPGSAPTLNLSEMPMNISGTIINSDIILTTGAETGIIKSLQLFPKDDYLGEAPHPFLIPVSNETNESGSSIDILTIDDAQFGSEFSLAVLSDDPVLDIHTVNVVSHTYSSPYTYDITAIGGNISGTIQHEGSSYTKPIAIIKDASDIILGVCEGGINGEYFFKNLVPGTGYTISAIFPDLNHIVVINPFDLAEGETIADLDIGFTLAPTITSTPITNAMEDAIYTYQVTASDADSDPLTYNLLEGPTGMGINSSTGLVTWNMPLQADVVVGSYLVRIEVTDNDDGTDEQSYTLNIINVNDLPVITSTPVTSVDEDADYTYAVTATDEDLNTNLTFALTQKPSANMNIGVSSGIITWTPGQNDNGSHTVIVEVSDGQGTTSQPYTLTVNPVNDAPVITSSPVTTATEDELYQYQVTATDEDSSPLTYDLDNNKPEGMTINTSTGLIEWTPTASQTGTVNVIVIVDDGDGETVTQPYQIVVSPKSTGTQHPWGDNENGILRVNQNWDYTLGYNFIPQQDGMVIELGGYFNGTKTVKLWQKSTGALLAQANVTSANDWSFASISPVVLTTGTEYTVAVYAGGAGASSRTINTNFPQVYDDILITESAYISGDARPTSTRENMMYGQVDIGFTTEAIDNNYPVIDSGPDASPLVILDDQTSSVSVSASDLDGDTLAYAWSASPDMGAFSGNTSNETFTPDVVVSSTVVTLTCTVTDGRGGSTSGSVDVTVNPKNPPAFETPWQTNENGTLSTDHIWNYTLGYHFTPKANGMVIQLGAYVNGTKKVSLWKRDTGELLAEADVTATNNWSYTDISPVSVVEGTNYTVAVYVAGSGGSTRRDCATFPQDYDSVTILGSCFASGDARPTNLRNDTMYGQADIAFEAGSTTGNRDPVIDSGPDASPLVILDDQTLSVSISASDLDGDTLAYAWSASPDMGAFSGNTSNETFTPDVVVSSTVVTLTCTVTDGRGGSTSGSVDVTVNPKNPPAFETPWQTNENGTLSTGHIWNYTLGYHFTPKANGTVFQLGAYVNGTKKVSLWKRDTGELLAEADVTAANNWSYTDISPVSVVEGTNYTVAVYVAGSGGSTRRDCATFPQDYDSVTILGSCFASGDARPTNLRNDTMFGQADIAFEAGSTTGNRDPVIDSGPDASPLVILDNQTSSVSVTASDLDGDSLAYTWSASLGSISGAGATVVYTPVTVAATTTVNVLVTIEDGNGGSTSGTVQLTVLSQDAKPEQTPWQDNANGVVRNDNAWDFTLGYNFSPLVEGHITKLGGFFNGTKTVKLWDKNSRTVLAEATLTSANGWVFAPISAVPVTPGTDYTVTVAMGGSGGSSRRGIQRLPVTYGDINIKSSCYESGDVYPRYISEIQMYGQVDVAFQPN